MAQSSQESNSASLTKWMTSSSRWIASRVLFHHLSPVLVVVCVESWAGCAANEPISGLTNRRRACRNSSRLPVLSTSRPDDTHHIHRPPAPTMPALANSARAVARSWTAHQMPVARAGCTAMQTRNASASSFDSPFKGSTDSTKIPSFAAYRNKNGEQSTKVFQYFMVGTMGALSALGAKATVQGKPARPQRPHAALQSCATQTLDTAYRAS